MAKQAVPACGVVDDLWGQVLMDHLEGRSAQYRLEFDSGYEVAFDAAEHFSSYFQPHELEALSFVHGRVLDIGPGAGRHMLWALSKGFRPTGVDRSPLAVEVCRRRGCGDLTCADILDAELPPATFDSVLLMGNNMGLAGSVEGTARLLRIAFEAAAPGAWLIGSFVAMDHVPDGERPERGVVARHRVAYRSQVGPFFDWAFFSTEQLVSLVREPGWQVRRVLSGTDIQSYLVASKPLQGVEPLLGLPEREVVSDLWEGVLSRAWLGEDVGLEIEGFGSPPRDLVDIDAVLGPGVSDAEKAALSRLRGRVLELGCGAGAALSFLADRGCSVIGLDTSDSAVGAAHMRGIGRARRVDWLDSLPDDGPFAGFVLLHNRAALAGDLPGVRLLLERLHSTGTPDAVLVMSYELSGVSFPGLARYVYEGRAGPWWHFAQFETDEAVSDLLERAGWRRVELLQTGPTGRIAIARRAVHPGPEVNGMGD